MGNFRKFYGINAGTVKDLVITAINANKYAFNDKK